MENSVNEISVEEHLLNEHEQQQQQQGISATNALKYLPNWPPVNIEFQDLVYSIPEIGGGKFL